MTTMDPSLRRLANAHFKAATISFVVVFYRGAIDYVFPLFMAYSIIFRYHRTWLGICAPFVYVYILESYRAWLLVVWLAWWASDDSNFIRASLFCLCALGLFELRELLYKYAKRKTEITDNMASATLGKEITDILFEEQRTKNDEPS